MVTTVLKVLPLPHLINIFIPYSFGRQCLSSFDSFIKTFWNKMFSIVSLKFIYLSVERKKYPASVPIPVCWRVMLEIGPKMVTKKIHGEFRMYSKRQKRNKAKTDIITIGSFRMVQRIKGSRWTWASWRPWIWFRLSTHTVHTGRIELLRNLKFMSGKGICMKLKICKFIFAAPYGCILMWQCRE